MLVAVILLMLGAVFTLSGVMLLVQKRRHKRDCLPAVGTLVDKVQIGKGRSKYNAFVVEYSVDGVDYRESIPSETAKGKFTVGEPIDILYKPEKPEYAYIARVGGEVFMFCVGGAGLLLGVLRLIFAIAGGTL